VSVPGSGRTCDRCRTGCLACPCHRRIGEGGCLPLQSGEPFHLDYINSIYLQPVRESFVYEQGEGLFIIQVETPSVGVFEYLGLIPDEPGKARLRRKLGEIRLLSSDYRDHRLIASGTDVRLKGLGPDGLVLILKVLTDRRSCP
jgi:hypothetical protein